MVNGGYDHAWSIFDANFEADNTASLEFGGDMFWDSFRAVAPPPPTPPPPTPRAS